MRSTTLAAPLLLALQREILERDAWPLLRVELPGQAAGFYDARARRATSTTSRAARARRGKGDRRARSASTRPTNARALAGVDPARSRARPARAGPLREASMQRRWCSTLWPTAGAGRSRRAWALGDFAAFVARALFLDRPDPVAAWGELRDVPGRS